MLTIKGEREFWSGAIYLVFASAILWLGAGYRMGTTAQMGPGYFPRALAVLLASIGIAALVRSFTITGAPLGAIAWRPLAHILTACAAFAALLNTFGLIVALVALMVISGAGSVYFRVEFRAFVGAVLVALLCAVVFVKGLGVPMPIIGPMIEPYVAPWLDPLVRDYIDPIGRVFTDLIARLRGKA